MRIITLFVLITIICTLLMVKQSKQDKRMDVVQLLLAKKLLSLYLQHRRRYLVVIPFPLPLPIPIPYVKKLTASAPAETYYEVPVSEWPKSHSTIKQPEPLYIPQKFALPQLQLLQSPPLTHTQTNLVHYEPPRLLQSTHEPILNVDVSRQPKPSDLDSLASSFVPTRFTPSTPPVLRARPTSQIYANRPMTPTHSLYANPHEFQHAQFEPITPGSHYTNRGEFRPPQIEPIVSSSHQDVNLEKFQPPQPHQITAIRSNVFHSVPGEFRPPQQLEPMSTVENAVISVP